MAKTIIFEVTIKDDNQTAVKISHNSPLPLSLIDMLGCLEILRQVAILSNPDFKKMYETLKIDLNDGVGNNNGLVE